MRESPIYAFMFLLWRYGIQQFYKDIAPHFTGSRVVSANTKAVFEDAGDSGLFEHVLNGGLDVRAIKTITVWKQREQTACVGEDHQGVFWSETISGPLLSNF